MYKETKQSSLNKKQEEIINSKIEKQISTVSQTISLSEDIKLLIALENALSEAACLVRIVWELGTIRR
jgi:hypothetical protein